MVPELLGIHRVASQSSLSRFFAGFTSAGTNLRSLRPLWRWCVERLPSRREGYTLDLDSTRLLHVDGHQEGVQTGYTRMGFKPCLHPLLAVLAEARLVVQLWLRAGSTHCGNNVVAFFLDLWEQRPRHVRLRAVRADSGFCMPELLQLWEQLQLPYIVVAKLTTPIQSLIRNDMVWTTTELVGIDVAEIEYQSKGWDHPRRLILIRHRQADRPDAYEKFGIPFISLSSHHFAKGNSKVHRGEREPATLHNPQVVDLKKMMGIPKLLGFILSPLDSLPNLGLEEADCNMFTVDKGSTGSLTVIEPNREARMTVLFEILFSEIHFRQRPNYLWRRMAGRLHRQEE